MRFWFQMIGLTAALFLMGGPALSQGIESSSWQSTYGDYQGNIPPVNAFLQFQGSGGFYRPGSNYGTLNGITYQPSNTGGMQVSGQWSYAQISGWFSFDVAPGGGSFNGTWGYSGQPATGYWRGTRSGGPPAPVPAPGSGP